MNLKDLIGPAVGLISVIATTGVIETINTADYMSTINSLHNTKNRYSRKMACKIAEEELEPILMIEKYRWGKGASYLTGRLGGKQAINDFREKYCKE